MGVSVASTTVGEGGTAVGSGLGWALQLARHSTTKTISKASLLNSASLQQVQTCDGYDQPLARQSPRHRGAVTLAAMRSGVDMNVEDNLVDVIDKTDFIFSATPNEMKVAIGSDDVTDQIRNPEVTANARHAASAPKVRAALVEMQRNFAADYETIVTEGRDQGTVAFPDAHLKFYLIADAEERAARRHAELQAKGDGQTLEQIQHAIEKRDKSDESRSVGPLKPAEDAIIVDTTRLTVDQVVDKLLSCVREKCSKTS